MLLGLGLLTLGVALVLAVQLLVGMRSLRRLTEVPASLGSDPPRVSIVVAARDEVRHIGAAVDALLNQDYPDFEVVVMDDRSTDGTGALLDRLAEGRERLRVVHVTELPPGWLGKNHALDRGASLSTGELILFTDADVMMRPDALRRAVSLLESGELDHLAVAPRIHVGGPWASITLTMFMVVFSMVFRPWKARDPKSRQHIGIGAFNLIRVGAYRSIGGHRSVALRPDDDVRLGRALKRAGFRQEAASGRDAVSVEWYPSLPAMARGLRKNAFAVVDYRLSLIVAGTALPILFTFWPVAALVLTSGPVWWVNAAIVALGVITTGAIARGHGIPLWTALAHPMGAALLLGIVWAAALRVVRTGSVEWRGTEYPLEELRGR